MTAAEDTAKGLYESYIQERSGEGFPEQSSRLPPELKPEFYKRVDLYRESLLLLTLIAESKTRNKFEQVLRAYEGFIFGTTPTDAGVQKRGAIQNAMVDLARLLNPSDRPREFNWAMEWLQGIGHTESNPVCLALFASSWLDEYMAVAKTIQKLEGHF